MAGHQVLATSVEKSQLIIAAQGPALSLVEGLSLEAALVEHAT